MQKQYLTDLEEKKKQAEAQVKIIAADALIELFPEGPDYAEMEEEFKRTDAAVRAAALAGEIQAEGISFRTTKDVEVNAPEALKWVLSQLLGTISPYDFEGMSNEALIEMNISQSDMFNWLTISPAAVKEIQKAVKDRSFYIPENVAQYTEKKIVAITTEKLINPKVVED